MEFGQLEVNTEAVERMRKKLDGAPEDTEKPKKRTVEDFAGKKLSDINLEQELVAQFCLVKQLQEDCLHDDDIPLNQRSQLAGQVASTLQQLIKMQLDLQKDEQLKRIESALIEAVALLPDDAKNAFFAEYEKIAVSVGATT